MAKTTKENTSTEKITYTTLTQVDTLALTKLLNKPQIRKHLIDHKLFGKDSIKHWINTKTQVDATQGCKVRAIEVDKKLAGWCAIQLENGQYEIAIVLDDQYWGLGKRIFQDMMVWAKVIGHKTIAIHFLHTRPEYTFLRKISKKVYQSEWEGNKFTSYELEVK